VLVVDDTEAVRVLIRRVLTRSGYQVDVAGSTREARALSPARYDLLLIDAHLGGEPGTVLIDELRAADPDSAQRCLLVTGGMADRAPAGVACLSKPFRPADLLSAVDAMRSASGHRRSVIEDPAGSAAGRSSSARGPGGHGLAAAAAVSGPGAQPAAGQLLASVRRLRAAERMAVADFLHDGPVQELTAATLSVDLLSRLAPDEARPYADQARRHLDAAIRPIRRLMDQAGPDPQAGSTLDSQVRRRTAWLPFAPVTVRDLRSPAGSGPDPAVIVDIVELALHALAGSAPPARAGIEVLPGAPVLEIVVTVTPLDDATVRAADTAAAETALARLAAALGGTGPARLGAFPWRVRIGLPRT
jgi:DNA-binding response OmpR family regulator